MRRSVLAAMVAALGCGSPRDCKLVPTSRQVAVPTGVGGQSLTVDVPTGFDVIVGCPVPNVTSVSAEVQDPGNNPVPAMVTFSPPDLPDAKAQVTFTPPVSGNYHLIVRFEPAFGTQQLELTVARDRSDAGFHSLPAPASCPAFGVAAGVPLCHDESTRLTALSPDGGIGSEVNATRFSVDEAGRVWTIGIGGAAAQLFVYALDGGAFVQLASAAGEGDAPLALVARGGRAVVFRTTVAELWQLDGGDLENAHVTNVSSFFGSTPQWCVSFAPPSQFAAADLANVNPPFFFNGTDMVPMQFPRSTVNFMQATFGAADDLGIWWTDGNQLSVERPVLAEDAGVIVSMPYSLGLFSPSPGVCPESEQAPILESNQVVASLQSGGIVLEKFPAAPGTLRGATDRIVWGIDQGRLFWWDR